MTSNNLKESITVRDASEADLPIIIDIYNESIPAGQSTADTASITVDERREWFGSFDPSRRPIWVAEHENAVVGCIYLSSFYGGRPAYDKTAEVSMYLASSHHAMGLGTFLLQKIIEACPRLGVTTLIGMHFDHNEASQRLASKFGFEQVGHLPEIAEVFGNKRGLVINILRIRERE